MDCVKNKKKHNVLNIYTYQDFKMIENILSYWLRYNNNKIHTNTSAKYVLNNKSNAFIFAHYLIKLIYFKFVT